MPVQHTFEGNGDPNTNMVVPPEPNAHYIDLTNKAQWMWNGDEWKLVTSKEFRPLQTNVLTKNPFGRWKTFLTGTVLTMQTTMEMSTDFYGLRIALPNLAETTVTGVRVAVAVTNDFGGTESFQTTPYPNGGGWKGIDWTEVGGTNSVDLPPRIAAERPSVTYSDVYPMVSIPRTNGSTRPLLMVRVQYPANSLITVPYSGFFGWRNSGGPHLPFRTSSQAVAGVDVTADYTTFTSIDQDAIIPMVQYLSYRQGHQIMVVGDSIAEGLGGVVRDFGAIPEACSRIATAQYPVEYYNCGLHAQEPRVYSKLFDDHIDKVLPTCVFYQPYSINIVPAGGAQQYSKDSIYGSLARAVRDLRDRGRGAPIFLLEGTPCNKNFRDTGAGDQWRRDFNASLLTMSGSVCIPGYAAAVTGVRDPDGQDLMTEGLTDDGVHPNQAGYSAMADAITPFIISIMPEEAGLG